MSAVRHGLLHLTRQPRPETIEAVCIVAILATGLALLTLVPYDELIRSVLCFKLYAGHGCAY